jgi:hypothetical protein
MSSVCELDYLVALLEEHGILSSSESESGNSEPWCTGHRRIYERVRATPTFPLSVAQVQALLERPR